MATMAASLAHLGMLRQCNRAARQHNPPQPPPPKSPRLANASTISEFGAGVGARRAVQPHAPRPLFREIINQHRRPTLLSAVASWPRPDARSAPARVVAAPSTEEAQEVVAETLSTRPPPPRRRANGEDEKLRLRRARNREAAERCAAPAATSAGSRRTCGSSHSARGPRRRATSDLEGRLAAGNGTEEAARLRGGAVAPGARPGRAEAPAGNAVKLRRRARGCSTSLMRVPRERRGGPADDLAIRSRPMFSGGSMGELAVTIFRDEEAHEGPEQRVRGTTKST